MRQRKAASDDFVHGSIDALDAISTHRSPATILGPKGDCVQGAAQVNSANVAGAKLFKPGGTNEFEIMHMAESGDLANWVGIQRSVVHMQGAGCAYPNDPQGHRDISTGVGWVKAHP